MSHLLSKRFKQLMLFFSLLFILLFLFRLGYGYVVVSDDQVVDEVYFDDFSSDNKKITLRINPIDPKKKLHNKNLRACHLARLDRNTKKLLR